MKADNRTRNPEIAELLNRAIESERGIKVWYSEMRIAYQVRVKLYAHINASKKTSMELYELDHPAWGRSPFEALQIRMEPPYNKNTKDAPCHIYIEKLDDSYFERQTNIKIEEL